jgi:uncharacterized protein (DUF2236 family)
VQDGPVTCLYNGAVDVYRMFVSEMDDETADRHYREGMALGTTLQVPAQMWPADRAAFDQYWQDVLDKVHIDDTVREYLYPIAVVQMRGATLPRPIQRFSEGPAQLITTGFLRNGSATRCGYRGMPSERRFDRRIRTGRPLV